MDERFGDAAGPQAHRGSTARLNGGFKEVRMAGWGRFETAANGTSSCCAGSGANVFSVGAAGLCCEVDGEDSEPR